MSDNLSVDYEIETRAHESYMVEKLRREAQYYRNVAKRIELYGWGGDALNFRLMAAEYDDEADQIERRPK